MLSTCIACYMNHGNIQQYFPLKPAYIPESIVEVIGDHEKLAAQRLVRDANIQWEKEYEHKLTDVIPRSCPQANLTKKKMKVEKKILETHKENFLLM